jgi:hypothetical protein
MQGRVQLFYDLRKTLNNRKITISSRKLQRHRQFNIERESQLL